MAKKKDLSKSKKGKDKLLFKRLKTTVGKKGQKIKGWKWDNKKGQKRWEKKGWVAIKPRKPKAPAFPGGAPATTPAAIVVKTRPDVVGKISTPDDVSLKKQTADLINAFLAMSSVSLWQYANKDSIEGKISDVNLILVLSEIRRQYNPNAIMDLSTVFIKNVTRTPSNDLVFEIESATRGRRMFVEFYLSGIDSIMAVDYA